MDEVAFIDALVTDDEIWEEWLLHVAQRADDDTANAIRDADAVRTIVVSEARVASNLQARKILAFLVIHAGFGITGRNDILDNPVC